ncbi:Serine/threonine protein kinase [Malassezia furfur]|uniref:non-specific serine/threonine protein kinase n=1 Tax=Malassezia furfur TaxID=55194 RepID=A0ABY8EPW4_MALFU|nr:SKS1 [Malassezia furfur]WFD46413.1 Serine/threonine protein kinase [Malassezia furfur]
MPRMSATQQPKLVGQRIGHGRYELESVLGLGAYGVVYRAFDLRHKQTSKKTASVDLSRMPNWNDSNTYVAVKCLDKSQMDSRQRAFQHRETLLHTMTSSNPNVVTLHEIIDDEDAPFIFIVMEYCPNGDLFSMITEKQRYAVIREPPLLDTKYDDGRPLPDDAQLLQKHAAMDMVIKEIFNQILDAVEHCHSLGIYHRDLKPDNILCSHDGAKVFLGDFGLATGDRWSKDFGCGSTFYMGPECQGGLGNRISHYNTAANDVWSLGVILINLICGRNPWKQATMKDEIFREYVRDPDYLLKILPISPETNAVLKRIFTLRPELRCSIRDLRRWVHAIPRLRATPLDIWLRQHPPKASHVPYRIACVQA